MDSFKLSNPGVGFGPFELGSYVQQDPGVDFGAQALYQPQYAHNPLVAGGQLAYLDTPVRTLTFPMRLASSASGGIDVVQNALMQAVVGANRGAYLDMLLDGLAAGQSVRWDILTGRIVPKYSLPIQRLQRREFTLELDVDPFAYMPTMMLLASCALGTGMVNASQIPGAFTLQIPAGSILGDAPPLMALAIRPGNGPTAVCASTGAVLSMANLQFVDGLAWSLARPSGAPFFTNGASLMPASWPAGQFTASVVGDFTAPASQCLRVFAASFGFNLTTFKNNYGQIAFDLTPPPMGRYRVFAYLRVAPSCAHVTFTADEAALDPVRVLPQPPAIGLASQYPVATVPAQGVASAYIPSAFQIVNLGDHSFPVGGASGINVASQGLRLWTHIPTQVGASQIMIDVGGVFYQALDGDSGLVASGLTLGNGPIVLLDAVRGIDAVGNGGGPGGVSSSNYASAPPGFDVRRTYYGTLRPQSPTSVNLDVLAFSRMSGFTNALPSGVQNVPVYTALYIAGASLHYRPRFSFTRGL